MAGKLLFALVIFFTMLVESRCQNGNLSYVHSHGAVCLDGSPVAYQFSSGFGAGIDNWIVKLQGGAWCENYTTCYKRSFGFFGSSKTMTLFNFTGILDNNSHVNPDFYNWNRVLIRYCDGGSYTGDSEAIVDGRHLYFKGKIAFDATIEDLKSKGMKNAKNAILSGCSAGGLGVFFHCDNFRRSLPTSTRVKCLADAGFFVNVKDISGASTIEKFYNDVVTTHGSEKALPHFCTSEMNPSLCFFPENLVEGIHTPLFILNSQYDWYQVANIFIPNTSDPYGIWGKCKNNLTLCNPKQLETIEVFRLEFIQALMSKISCQGLFINSCNSHCQTEGKSFSTAPSVPHLNNKTIMKAFSDWFFNGSPFQSVECPHPCRKDCYSSN